MPQFNAFIEPVWPVWIWDPGDYDHSASYTGYVRVAERARLEGVLDDLATAGFELDCQVGGYMQTEPDVYVAEEVTSLLTKALEGYADEAENQGAIAAVLAGHGLRLVGSTVVEA